MNEPRLLLQQLQVMSANLNGLVIPPGEVQSALGRYVFNLVVMNDDVTFPVSLVGSATALRFRGRNILLCTQHQMKERNPQDIALMSEDNQIAVTSAGVRSYRPDPETDAYDIVASDFTEPCDEHPEFRRRFFDFSEVPPDTLNDQIVAFTVAGFPSQDQGYLVQEEQRVHLVKRSVTALLDRQPADPSVLLLKTPEEMKFDADGMSGGSAFVVQVVNGEFRAYFAGMILRGGKSHFYMLKAGYIRAFLESAVRAWSSSQ